jgi:N-acetylneuraminic acid mutarotase
MSSRFCPRLVLPAVVFCLAFAGSPPDSLAEKRVFARVEPNGDAVNASADIFDPASGIFAPSSGAMNAARQIHTAVLLRNGKIFIAGGFDGNGYLASAELYDPGADSFTLLANTMSVARAGHTVSLLQSGRVLIAGGFNGKYLGSAEIYDPDADTFTTTTGYMNAERWNHTATLLSNGKVLIAGGFNGSYLSSAELYDPANKTFSTTGAMTAARAGHSATLLSDGKVLIVGGFDGSKYLESAEIYDPSTGEFTLAGSKLNTARDSHTATLLSDGKVLIAGGFDGSHLKSAEIYDPSSGRFTTVSGSMTAARAGHTAVLLAGGKVLLAGGYDGTSYLASAEIFDPAGGTFTATAAPMSAPRQRHTATALGDGRILIAGGQNQALLTFDVNSNVSDNVSPSLVFSADSRVGFVPYTGSGIIVAFSAETGDVLKRIETGGNPALATPLPDGKTLAVVSALEDRIFIVDMEAMTLRTTYTFTGAQFGFGSFLTLSPDGRYGYISSTGTGEVIKFQLSDGKESGRLKGLVWPAQITVTRDGSLLLVVDTSTEEVVFADAGTLTKKYSLKTRDKMANSDLSIFNRAVLAPDEQTGIIAVRDTGGSLVSGKAFIFKTSNGEVLATEEIGSLPGFTGITPDGSKWVILNEFSFTIIPTANPDSSEDISTVRGEPLGSANVVFSPDSRYAFYASSANDLVFQHDLETTAVVGQVLVGDYPNKGLDQPSSIAITPDGRTIGVLDFISNSIDLLMDVSVISTSKFIASGNQFTGLSLINLSDRQTKCTVYALDNIGRVITADGLENPVELNLAPNAQVSVNVSQIFNLDLDSENTGRITVWTDHPEMVGYFSIGQITPTWLGFYLNRLDGAPMFRKPLHDWIVPEIPTDSSESAQLNFVNPAYSSAAYDLKHYSSDGTLSEERSGVSSGAQNRLEQSAGELFTSAGKGKVLVAGGQASASTADTSNSAETYDSSIRAFSATGSMTTSRAGHTATVLVNGKVLIAGGRSGNTILASAETYDIAGGTFTATADSMSVERQRHTATLLPNGKVLLAGGQNSISVTDTAEIYDPATDTFSPTAGTMTIPRDGHTATLLANGKVLIAGGIGGDTVTARAELYDPATGKFSATGSMVTARVFHTATRLANGTVLIAGGFNGTHLAGAEIYDPATGSFRPAAGTMNAARSSHTATLLSSGKVLIAGGSDGSGPLKSAEIYDPVTESFLPVANSMTAARSAHTATLLSDGKVLLAGGNDSNGPLKSAETYDPATQEFQSAGSPANARSGHTATFLEPSIGGYVRSSSRAGLHFTEFFRRGKDGSMLNGIDVEQYRGVTHLYAPQFAVTPGFITVLNLINANTDEDAEVVLTLHGPGGEVLGTPRTLPLPRGAQIKDDLNSIFEQDPAIQNTTGWLEVQSSVDRVLGTVSFTNSDGVFLTSLALSGTPLTRFLFPIAAEDGMYQTGIALLNAGDRPAAVTMELWQPDGSVARRVSRTLAPRSRTALYLQDYFPGLAPQLVGNIRVASDQPVHSFALLNDRSFHFIAAVPPIPYPEETLARESAAHSAGPNVRPGVRR